MAATHEPPHEPLQSRARRGAHVSLAVSVAFDGDFNQMLELPLGAGRGSGPRTVWDVRSLTGLAARPIATGAHGLGCAADSGSSCGGTLR